MSELLGGGWRYCVPENVSGIIDLGGPLRLAAMALSVVSGHGCCGLMIVSRFERRSIENGWKRSVFELKMDETRRKEWKCFSVPFLCVGQASI